MSDHSYLFILPAFFALTVVANVLVRKKPGLRRPIGIAAGLLVAAIGLSTRHILPDPVAADLFRWVLVGAGALLTLGAALNWLPTPEDDAPLRPDTNRPPRHFGEAS
jgi:hypothetical protein